MAARVLIVDDHRAFRAFARLTLARAGYDVVGEAQNARSALAAVQALRPDIVVLDVGLPDCDGIALAARLGREERPPRVILVSSRDAGDYGRRLREAGVAFIPKAELSGRTVDALVRPS